MSAGRGMVANYFAETSVYDVRKVWRQLKREGVDVARCTVSRLMRDMGLQGVIRGKSVKTTVSDKAAPCPLVSRFKGAKPNVLWLSDFTYVATRTGFVYFPFLSAVSEIPTTMLSPKPATVSTRLR